MEPPSRAPYSISVWRNWRLCFWSLGSKYLSWWHRCVVKCRFDQPKHPKYPFMAPRLCLKLVFIVWDSIYLTQRAEYGFQNKSDFGKNGWENTDPTIWSHDNILTRFYDEMLTCLARSSAELMGATMRSTVRKAARLAVYEEIKIKEKNHQTPPWQGCSCSVFCSQLLFGWGSRMRDFVEGVNL